MPPSKVRPTKKISFIAKILFVAVVLLMLWRSCIYLGGAWAPDLSQAIAAWAQAIGSVAALMISACLFFAQRRFDKEKAEGVSLQEQLRTVATLSQVMSQTVECMRQALDHMDTHGAHGVNTFRVDNLIRHVAILDRFVDPSLGEVCCVGAIQMARLASDAQTDFLHFSRGDEDWRLERCSKRIVEAHSWLDGVLVVRNHLTQKDSTRDFAA